MIHRLESSQTPVTPDITKNEAQIFALWGDFNRALECAASAYNPSSRDYSEHLWHGQVLKLLARRAQREGHLDQLPEIARQAEDSFRTACEIAHTTPECWVELVQLLTMTNQREKARYAASDAKEAVRLSARPLAMGYIYEALGDMKQAGENYEKAVKAQPDRSLAIRVLADFYLRGHDSRRAVPLIERLLSGEIQTSQNDLVIARRMKASILVEQGYGKLKEAMELVDRNLASPLAGPQDKQLKIRLLLLDSNRAQGPEILELAESLANKGGAEPDPEDRFRLARLYLDRGNWDRCQEQMLKLVNGAQPNPLYLALYVRMLLDRDQLGDAESLLERLGRIASLDLTVPLRAELLHRRKKWGSVPNVFEEYVADAKADSKKHLERVLLSAQLLEHLGSQLGTRAEKELARNYFEKSRQWYEAYVAERPESRMLLAGFHARSGKVEEALDQIDRHGQTSNPVGVFEVVDAIVTRPRTTPAQLKRLESLLATLLDKTQRPSPLLVALAEVQAALGRPQDSEKIYREILAKDSSDDTASNNLSMILALQKTKLDEALSLTNKTIERSGPLPPFLDTRAVVYIARHEPRRAILDLEAAALAEKDTPLRLFHKAWAYLEDGDSLQARDWLNRARGKGLEDSVLSEPEREVFKQIVAKPDL